MNNFNFSFMLLVNLMTYMIIKVIDYLNSDKAVTRVQKRVILVVSIIILATAYIISGYENKIILINSSIAAPVFWSWVLKPICVKFNIDYKQIDKILN